MANQLGRYLLVILAALSLSAEADAKKRARPTMECLAGVWIGGSPVQLEFMRINLDSSGKGLLTLQYIPGQAAEAYSLTIESLDGYEIRFNVIPIDEDAEPIYLKGKAFCGDLHLEFGRAGEQGWSRSIILDRYSQFLERLEAVEKRAREYEQQSPN